jgi:hypothetical protein
VSALGKKKNAPCRRCAPRHSRALAPSHLPSRGDEPSRAQYLEHPSATQLQGKLRAPAPPTPPPPADGTLPFLEALAQCDTLECLRHAHAQPRAHPTFNFPHFLVIGFQKAATTSLFG